MINHASPEKGNTITVERCDPTQVYDGKEYPRAFHRLVKESTIYLENAEIKPKRYAYTLSQYSECCANRGKVVVGSILPRNV